MMPKRCVAGLLAMFLAAPLSAQEAKWLVAPYLWYSDISLDQSSRGNGGSEISASDLLDISDSAGMFRMEVTRSHWGLTLDYVWVDVSDDRALTLPVPPNPTVNIRTSLSTTIFELGGFYSLSGTEEGPQVLLGGRQISVDKTLLVTPQGGLTERFDSKETPTDVYLGARILHRFNDRWDFTARGDYGFGDSEGSLNLLATVGYRFNDTFALNLGYRHFDVEYVERIDDATETTEVSLSGPALGLMFRF